MATILVVDDDPAARKPMTRLLQMDGHEVICACDAHTAMAQAIDRHPDLILLDVAMPKMDGLTFLKHLRVDPAVAHTPVMLLTARRSADPGRLPERRAAVRVRAGERIASFLGAPGTPRRPRDPPRRHRLLRPLGLRLRA